MRKFDKCVSIYLRNIKIPDHLENLDLQIPKVLEGESCYQVVSQNYRECIALQTVSQVQTVKTLKTVTYTVIHKGYNHTEHLFFTIIVA